MIEYFKKKVGQNGLSIVRKKITRRENSTCIIDKFKDKIEGEDEDLDDTDTESKAEETEGGNSKNIIELEDVFKLYYNSDEIITNIYKLYFIINIYGYYYRDNVEKYELIENLLEIIKIDVYNNDIIETIKTITTNIYKHSIKIYEKYIRFFDKTDRIIKNFCQTQELIYKYLNMNFIYDFYKNYKKKDINILININGVILQINKSLDEINKEIDVIFINGECLFPKSSYIINMNIYDNEIDNFIHFIYDFTKNQSSIILKNINDVNAFIVLQLLSNENEKINLKINDEDFIINNINNHPYKLHMTDNFNIDIKLNKIQFELYKKIFQMDNINSLLGILGKDYYYLDFNINNKSNFKFYLNYEIIPFISYLNIDDNYKRTIINYNSYKPMMIDELKDLSILSYENNSMIFLINYGILLSSTLLSQINIKNFISLIYIYFTIKNNTKKYLKLYNYNGDDLTIIIYRDYIKSINIINFFSTILFQMRIKLNLNMDIKNFIKKVINFKENSFIKTSINIDVNFIQTLFNLKSFKTNKKFIEDFYLSFLLIYKNCMKKYINNETIKMFHIFIIPCLRYFHNKINVIEIENEILDIKAMEYIKLIGDIKGGEGEQISTVKIEKPENINEINIDKVKNELKENQLVSTTKLSDNTKEILKLLEDFNLFNIEFNKLDIQELINDFKKSLEFYLIDNIYISSNNTKALFKDYKETANKKDILNDLSSIISKILYNKRNLEEIKKQYSYNLKDKDNELNEKCQNLNKLINLIERIKTSLKDENKGIKKYKDNSIEVANLFVIFNPDDDNGTSLIDKIEEYINYYKKKIDKFLVITGDYIEKYKLLYDDIKKHETRATEYFNKEETNMLNLELEQKNKNKQTIYKLEEKLNKIEEDIRKVKIQIDTKITLMDNHKTSETDKQKHESMINEFKIELEKLEKEKKEIETNISKLSGNEKKGGGVQVEKIEQDDPNIKKLFDIDFSTKEKDEKLNYEQRKNDIKKKFENIKKDFRKLKVSTYIPNSVNKDMIIEKFINKKGDTLFEQILNNYTNDVKEKNIDIAKLNFYDNVENNNLDPIKELEITFIDKLIFAFLTIFLRYGGLYMTYRFIDNNLVKSIKEAIIYYSISYIAILFTFVLIVNIDLFRLRIIFNYCNLHINSGGILSHMIIILIIGYIIYLLIINMDNVAIPTYLSKNEKIKLKKKLDILSMIVIIFILIFILII